MLPIDVVLCADESAVASPVVDSSYGRLEQDSALALSAGAAFNVRGVRGSVDLRYRYLHTAGIFVTYEESFGDEDEPLRVITGGLELRPLFLGRYLQGLELGIPRLDLFIDSIAFEFGGFAAQRSYGNFGDAAGLSFGIGAEFPLLKQTSGPFLAFRAALRWSREALSAADATTVDVEEFVFTVAFGWQVNFGSHAVDVGDVRSP